MPPRSEAQAVEGVGVGVAGAQQVALEGVGEGVAGVVVGEVAGREGAQLVADGAGDGVGRGAVQGAQEDFGGRGLVWGFVRAARAIDGRVGGVHGGAVWGGGHLFIVPSFLYIHDKRAALLLPLH
jgi:hypothetical protein